MSVAKKHTEAKMRWSNAALIVRKEVVDRSIDIINAYTEGQMPSETHARSYTESKRWRLKYNTLNRPAMRPLQFFNEIRRSTDRVAS
jgi:hypothetical protein